MIEEVIYISDFNVKLDGTIAVRKTTDVTKDGAVIASSYWRVVLAVNDPAADEVLGVDGYYRTLANDAWAMVPPSPSPAPEVEEVAAELPSEAEVVTPEPSTEEEVVAPEPSTEAEGVAAELPTE
jgi:hypothetical protein